MTNEELNTLLTKIKSVKSRISRNEELLKKAKKSFGKQLLRILINSDKEKLKEFETLKRKAIQSRSKIRK
jgi:hypothetical protein